MSQKTYPPSAASEKRNTLETTLGGMVCALDEDQVGEFVPALHNISAQYHVDRAHSIRIHPSCAECVPHLIHLWRWQGIGKSPRRQVALKRQVYFGQIPEVLLSG